MKRSDRALRSPASREYIRTGPSRARIPLEARIVRITDAFDAMTNRRPYCATRPFEEALAELDRWAGRQFDPELVATMIELIRNDQAVRGALDRLAGRAGHSE